MVLRMGGLLDPRSLIGERWILDRGVLIMGPSFSLVVEVDIPPTGAPWLGADVCAKPFSRHSAGETSVFVSLDCTCAMPLVDKGAADESHRLAE